MTDTPEIQRQIIRGLERERVRYFVRSTEWVSLGAMQKADKRGVYFTMEGDHQPQVLIDHIEKNYDQVLYCGVLQVYERKTPFGGRGSF